MTMREKLIELFYDNVLLCSQKIEGLADDVMDIISNGVTLQKWIPVTERLPEVAITHNNRWEKSTESVHVLCCCKQKSGKRMVKEGSCKVFASGTIYWMIPGTIDVVTHWMPLPDPPKGE